LPPSGETISRGLDLHGLTAAQPLNSRLLGTTAKSNIAEDLDQVNLKSLPAHLNTQRMVKQWQVWMNHRRAFRKPKNWAVMFNAQIDFLEPMTEPEAFESVSASIRNGWQGLFEPKSYEKRGPNGKPNPRNTGIATDPTEQGRKAAAYVARQQAKNPV
jgi:hypothetical protein